MPLIKSAIKRMKQTAKRRERNLAIKRDVKLATKAFLANPSAESLSKAQSELDTAVKKGLLKKGTVSRCKAALVKVAKAAGVKPTAKKTAKTAPVAKPTAKKPAAKAKTTTKTASTKPAAKKTKKADAKK